MELKTLRAFVALAESLNFRLAAERIHVSQPALSMQLKALEGQLGLTLVRRGQGRTVQLTPAELECGRRQHNRGNRGRCTR